MNNKNIIIAGVIAIGVYLFSQGKSIFSAAAPQITRQRTAQKVSQKVDISTLPVAQIRYMISHAAALKKTREEVAALKAEEARRVAAWKLAQKVAQKRIGQPTTQAAYISAARKAAAQKRIRREAAQIIGKKIGKTVAQKVVPQILEETGGRTGMALVVYLQKKAVAMHAAATQAANAVKNNTKEILPSSKWAGGRTGMALVIHLKRREEEIKRAIVQAKAAVPTTKLFSGAEKSTIIPYSESSKHSYYGPKSHKVLNEGYMEKRYKADLKQAEEQRLNELRAMFPLDEL